MLYKHQKKQLDKQKTKENLAKMHANTKNLRDLIRTTLTDTHTSIRPDLHQELNKSITFIDDLGLVLNRLKKSL